MVSNAAEGTSVTINADYVANYNSGNGSSVWVNGAKLVRGQDYTDASGSVIITLLPDYLQTLANGTYTVEIRFADGGIATAALVKGIQLAQPAAPAPAAPAPVATVPAAATPNTAGSRMPMLWLTVMVLAVTALLGFFLLRRMREPKSRVD